MQYDPEFKRMMVHRELLGNQEQLSLFAPKALAFTRALVGPGFTVFDTCDPHGKDQRDVGESSVEYLRIHHQVHCNAKREMQELIITKAPWRAVDWKDGDPIGEECRFLVDAHCKGSIAAYMGGYYRDEDGKPAKDDFHDHFVDVCRYGVVHQMGSGLAYMRKKNKTRYTPTDKHTAYRSNSFIRQLKENAHEDPMDPFGLEKSKPPVKP